MRKITDEAKEGIRENAIKKYEQSKNISKVARELSINRQVLHEWIFRDKIYRNRKPGRRELNLLPESQIEQIIGILSGKLPSYKNIKDLFWSVESVRELINKKYNSSPSAYLVRKQLKKWGFGKNISKLVILVDKCKSVTLGELSKRYNRPCYYFQKVFVKSRDEDYRFYCLTSLRGDIGFAGLSWWNKVKKDYNYELEVFMIIKIQELARKRIVIVIPKNFSSPYFHFWEKSKRVMLLKVENKVLNPIRLLQL
ncbi:MAG: COG3415 family protein [Sedimentisphaerales bacterium]